MANKNTTSHHEIWSNYSDLTRPISPQIGGLVRDIPLFQGNLGWWNIIIIWPDEIMEVDSLAKTEDSSLLF